MDRIASSHHMQFENIQWHYFVCWLARGYKYSLTLTFDLSQTFFIEASLSEPHTSGTALWKCVNVQACLRPYTVNFKWAHSNISRRSISRALDLLHEAGLMRATARVQRRRPGVKAHVATSDLSLYRPSTAGRSQAVQTSTDHGWGRASCAWHERH